MFHWILLPTIRSLWTYVCTLVPLGSSHQAGTGGISVQRGRTPRDSCTWRTLQMSSLTQPRTRSWGYPASHTLFWLQRERERNKKSHKRAVGILWHWWNFQSKVWKERRSYMAICNPPNPDHAELTFLHKKAYQKDTRHLICQLLNHHSQFFLLLHTFAHGQFWWPLEIAPASSNFAAHQRVGDVTLVDGLGSHILAAVLHWAIGYVLRDLTLFL